MTEKKKDIKSINAIFDVRAETLAANILAQVDHDIEEFGLEGIVISPMGGDRRRVSQDVELVKRKNYDHDSVLLIGVNRKGIFDNIPERLFLRLNEEYKSAKKRTKAIKEQTAQARKFFLPYEQALYHPRIEAEQLEQKYTETFPQFIHEIWGLPQFASCLDDRQRFLLCYLLPEAYRVAGDWKLTGLLFEAVLKKPIDLNFIEPIELDIPNSNRPASELRLGQDAILGEKFKDDTPTLVVTVKGVTYNDLDDFLPGGKDRVVLEDLLCGYFIPLDVHFIIKILVTEDTFGCILGRDVLGYNTQFVS